MFNIFISLILCYPIYVSEKLYKFEYLFKFNTSFSFVFINVIKFFISYIPVQIKKMNEIT